MAGRGDDVEAARTDADGVAVHHRPNAVGGARKRFAVEGTHARFAVRSRRARDQPSRIDDVLHATFVHP